MVVTAPVARWVDPDVGTEVLDGGTVAPVASVPPPPPGVDGSWVVYTTGEIYDESGARYEPVQREIDCVPAAEVEAGVPEVDLS